MQESDKPIDFILNLEARLKRKSDKVEELHMEAAIDAELIGIEIEGEETPANPNSVANCLSPYVPTTADRIDAFLSWVGLKGPTSPNVEGDVLLDIGCGDGRVCISAAKMYGKHS